ncbi:hypothetical protein C8R47DRAFT_1193052 [Mycena vitilis]|nr:hypothetical protein C8R47DRAFT_1193052 [Mycena vitilis]
MQDPFGECVRSTVTRRLGSLALLFDGIGASALKKKRKSGSRLGLREPLSLHKIKTKRSTHLSSNSEGCILAGTNRSVRRAKSTDCIPNPAGIMPQKTDEELVQEHQTKTDVRLVEVRHKLRDAETQAAKLRHKGETLEAEIRALQEAPQPENPELISGETLHDHTALETATSALRQAAKARQVRWEGRHSAYLRWEAALCIPITLEAFRAAPVRKLPAELVVQIILAGRPERNLPFLYDSVPRLSQVCGEWRAITATHPTMWASFSFGVFDARPSTLGWLGLYLERSKSAPLAVQLDATRRLGKAPSASGALALLATHSERLYSLTVVGHVWPDLILSGLHLRLPRLENLRLPYWFNDESYHQFEICPRLHTLTLDGTAPQPPSLPLSQIRTLHIMGCTNPAELLQFSNISSLTFTLREMSLFEQWNHATMPRLNSLRMDFSRDSLLIHDFDFFSHFTTPALEALEIASLPPPVIVNIAAFLRRSQCSLKKLVLENSHVDAAELRHIFEYSPHLHHFAVTAELRETFLYSAKLNTYSSVVQRPYSCITAPLLELLTVQSDLGTATLSLLNLRRLVIEGIYTFADELLVDMLESRVAAMDSRLDAIELVSIDRIVADEYVKRLRRLRGVSVLVGHRSSGSPSLI